MSSLRAIATAALAASALALTACGGESDEDQVKELATQLANTDEKVCDSATDKFLASLGGKKRCEQAAKSGEGDSQSKAKVGKTTVDGDKATVVLTADGMKARVGMVKDGDSWKLDTFR